jgi:hypothetical protein
MSGCRRVAIPTLLSWFSSDVSLALL